MSDTYSDTYPQVNDNSMEVKEKWKQGIRTVRSGGLKVVNDIKEIGCEAFPKIKGCDLVRSAASGEGYNPDTLSAGLRARDVGDTASTDRSSIGSSNSGKSFDESGSSSGGGSSSSGSLESSSSGSAAGQFIFLLLLLLCCLGICGGLAYAFKKGMFGKSKKKKRTVATKPQRAISPTPPPMTTGEPIYLEKQVVDGGVAPPQMMEAPPPIVIDEQLGFPMQGPGMAALLSAPGFAGYMPTPQVEFPGMTMPQIFPTTGPPVSTSPTVSASTLPAYATMPQLPSTFTPAPPIAPTGAMGFGTVPAVPTTALPYR